MKVVCDRRETIHPLPDASLGAFPQILYDVDLPGASAAS